MNLSKEIEQMLIMKLLGFEPSQVKEESPMVGKVCMVRTYSAGVHFGEVVSKQGQNVVLKNARRVWYWDGACSLSQLSMEGSKNISNCKITVRVDEIELDQVVEVCPMTEDAIKNLDKTTWKK